jgi:hypothetical protein
VVYAGGSFSQINGVNAQSIAEWNGSQWLPLGNPGLNPSPEAFSIAVDGTNVYVGGAFSTPGPNGANGIAMWNGTQWYAPASGGVTGATIESGPVVNSIGLANGQVYVGGAFLAAGGDATIQYFAAWNGTNWYSLGPKIGFVDGQFTLFLSDLVGRTYGVLASSNLVNWTRVTTFTNLGSYSQFIDSASTNMSQRYYRLVVP